MGSFIRLSRNPPFGNSLNGPQPCSEADTLDVERRAARARVDELQRQID